MATSKYSDIEIQTAKNLLKNGFKWLARNEGGKLFTHSAKPVKGSKIYCSDGYISCVCGEFVPIFQNIKFEDSEPTSLEAIVHPQILTDAEKRYLKGVIRPFRDRVESIEKVISDNVFDEIADNVSSDITECYILIHFTNENDYMGFPNFHESEMYKGMEINRMYTLEELGL